MHEFHSYLATFGLAMAGPVQFNGKLHRVSFDPSRKDDDSGWYVAHDYGDIQVIVWGDWRTGEKETWTSKSPKTSPKLRQRVKEAAEIAMARAEAARETAVAERAETAFSIWQNAEPDQPHPYLEKKGIGPEQLRVDSRGSLVVPMRDRDGVLKNVQRIEAGGKKKFFGPSAGLSWQAPLVPADGDLVLCEGVATGASLRKLTGLTVWAALTAGNLGKVAAQMRQRFPDRRILIAADNDRLDKSGAERAPEKNVGVVASMKAAKEVGGFVLVPEFPMESKGTDWNDLVLEIGEEAAAEQWRRGVKVAALDARVARMTAANFGAKKEALIKEYAAIGLRLGMAALNARRKELAGGEASKDEKNDEEVSAGQVLMQTIAEVELWHDQDEMACATYEDDGRLMNTRVDGRRFHDWLRMEFEERSPNMPPPSATFDAVLKQAGARARRRGERHQSFLRVAWDKDTRWLDLGDAEWRAVRIDAKGWRVETRPGIKFLRPAGYGEMIEPEHGNRGMAALWDILNVVPEDRVLVAGFLLQCLMGNASCFGMNLTGTQGTAKTMAMKLVRWCIDRAGASSQGLREKDVEGLAVTCKDQWVPCFDNVSGLTGEAQDILCRFSTGEVQKTRALYTNDEVHLVQLRRSWIISSIPNVCSRDDLAERTIPVALEVIGPGRRKTEVDVEAAFDAVQGEILGALCTAAAQSLALREPAKQWLAENGLEHRMADALLWITAGEDALGFQTGDFIRRLLEVQAVHGAEELDGNPVVRTIEKLFSESSQRYWRGTTDEFLVALRSVKRFEEKGPEDARSLGVWFKRNTPRLEKSLGIVVGEREQERGGGNRDRWTRAIYEKQTNDQHTPYS